MTTTRLVLVAGLALSLAALGCEEKKAETTKAADASKSMMDKAKDTASKAAENVKEGTVKAVEAVKDSTAKAVEATKEGTAKAVEAVKEGAAKAVALVSNETKTAMKGYLDSLGATSGILAKITTPADATGQLGTLNTEASKVAGFIGVLDKATAEVKSALKTEFGAQLEPIAKAFNDQKDRIMKDGALSKILGDTLAKFKALSF